MNILYYNNDYKYETEAIIKLFFTAETFSFHYDTDDTDSFEDVILISREVNTDIALLKVFVRLDNHSLSSENKIRLDCDDYNKECELAFCKMLYTALSGLTGISPSWGVLTGIRPVKKVNQLVTEGKTEDEIRSILKEKYFVKDDKIDLAYLTSVTQMPLLNSSQDSFSLYVSIPFCPTRCSYCSFVSHSMATAIKLIPDYIDKLCEEIKITAAIADKLKLNLNTVYFGGGTPTSITAEQLNTIMQCVSANFNLSQIQEYTVEAGRADTITKEKLMVIKNNGAKRISINPQTMNNDVLRAIGRNHTAEQTIDAYNMAREIGFDVINMDLIAGLPTDTAESFRNSVDKVIALKPENITVHTLTLKRSATLFSDKKEYKDASVKDMTDYSAKQLIINGYNPYYLYRQKNTIDNLENVGYSTLHNECLYNIHIMEETQTILAVGAAASTKLCDIKTGKIKRVYNYKFPYEYISRFDKLMEKKSEIEEFYKQYTF